MSFIKKKLANFFSKQEKKLSVVDLTCVFVYINLHTRACKASAYVEIPVKL